MSIARAVVLPEVRPAMGVLSYGGDYDKESQERKFDPVSSELQAVSLRRFFQSVHIF